MTSGLESALVPLSTLQRLPRNPKGHAAVGIGASISRFGFLERILINRTTGHLLAGHGRLDELERRRAAAYSPVKRDGWRVLQSITGSRA
jgi:hypothetical protein